MPKIPSRLTGTAGEHYVAFKLSCLGFIAAMTRDGSPTVDILVSNLYGNKTLAIQVKTTDWATRTRGRGKSKKPYELQFPLGYNSANRKDDDFFFTFVDLNGLDWDEKEPDVYIVPSNFVYEYCKSWIDKVKMVRLHIEIDKMEQFKNNWELLKSRLQ